MIKVIDMPKLQSPFVREIIDDNYVVTDKIEEGFEWVFEDDNVMAIEKLHGTNVSIIVQDGVVTAVFNRTSRIPFFNKNHSFIIKGLLNSYKKGYITNLLDGQHFGELIGPKLHGNPYNLKEHIWIPYSTYGQKHLLYKSWGKYPKDFNTISEWFKELFPLYNLMKHGNKDMSDEEKKNLFVEGIVFTHPDGRMAKLRKDMFSWFEGRRHGGGNKNGKKN